MKKLIIIPAYNEALNLEKVIIDIHKNANDYEYIIINDCSTDNTKEVCKNNKYNVINLPVNLGIGGCVQTGYKYAFENGFDIAVQVDGDGQHDASYINNLEKKMLSEQVDMCIGSRFLNKSGFKSTASRRMGIKVLSSTINVLFSTKITDPTSGFRMSNKSTIELFAKNYPIDYPEPETIATLLRNKSKILEVDVQMKEREEGESSINFARAIYYMIKVTLAIIIDKFK